MWQPRASLPPYNPEVLYVPFRVNQYLCLNRKMVWFWDQGHHVLWFLWLLMFHGLTLIDQNSGWGTLSKSLPWVGGAMEWQCIPDVGLKWQTSPYERLRELPIVHWRTCPSDKTYPTLAVWLTSLGNICKFFFFLLMFLFAFLCFVLFHKIGFPPQLRSTQHSTAQHI